jgi:hypothetical protein
VRVGMGEVRLRVGVAAELLEDEAEPGGDGEAGVGVPRAGEQSVEPSELVGLRGHVSAAGGGLGGSEAEHHGLVVGVGAARVAGEDVRGHRRDPLEAGERQAVRRHDAQLGDAGADRRGRSSGCVG